MKLFVAIPIYGGVPADFMMSLMKLQAEPPCDLTVQIVPGDSLVARARNTLTAQFLKTDCSHLLFIDSDLVFSGEQIKRLIAHDKDVVAGFYPKKQDGPLNWVCNAHLDNPKPDEQGLLDVRYMGTGFILIKRSVFEAMMLAYASIAYHPDANPSETEWDFWTVGPYKDAEGFSRYLSEDWYFCQRWLDLGGKVYGDTRVILKHIGHATYPLQSQLASIETKQNLMS